VFEVGYSMVKSFRRCPKQYEYKYRRNLQRRRPAPPLIRGTIFHEMLDARALRSMRKPTRTPDSILNSYAEKYAELFREERDMYGETFVEDMARVWDNYESRYANDGWKYEASEEEVITELVGEKNGDISILYKGHLDKRIVTKYRRWIVDHKTHKNIPTEEARFNDYQILLYLWAYNREVPKSQRADGLIWDYLRTKPPTIPEPLKKGGLSQAQNQDTDWDTYVRELKRLRLDPAPYAAFLDSLKKRSPTKFFLRVPLPEPSREMTESVVVDFRTTALQIRDAKTFPRHPTRDCSWCEYNRLCTAEFRGLDHKFIEKTDFEERPIGDENAEEE
jgi:PD-(D/E)XK nuclease superfamily